MPPSKLHTFKRYSRRATHLLSITPFSGTFCHMSAGYIQSRYPLGSKATLPHLDGLAHLTGKF
jgi:hypothetical protein